MDKKIAYVTDAHLDEDFIKEQGIDSRKNWQIILEDIASKNIKNVIYGGDFGEPESHNWFFDSLKDYNLSVTLGNHDEYSQVIKHFENEQKGLNNELFYSYEDSHFKYIFLDSSSDTVSKAQIKWLTKEIESSKNILLFIHHPVLEIESIVDKKFPLHNRDEIKSLLLQSGKKIRIYTGHYHLDYEIRFDNILQITTPAVSYQVVQDPNEIILNTNSFGYRIIELNGDEVFTQVIDFHS